MKETRIDADVSRRFGGGQPVPQAKDLYLGAEGMIDDLLQKVGNYPKEYRRVSADTDD